MKVGRPTKYNPDSNPEIIKLMSEGASIVEVAAMLKVSRETIYDWCNVKSDRYIKEFSDTIKEGVSLSESWWENQGRTSLKDKEFNATLWYMNMKNRFKWSDRSIVDNNISAPNLSIQVTSNDKKEDIERINDRTD